MTMRQIGDYPNEESPVYRYLYVRGKWKEDDSLRGSFRRANCRIINLNRKKHEKINMDGSPLIGSGAGL